MNRLVGIITAVLVLGACGTSIAWVLGRSSSADVTSAKMVDSCEVAHHLQKQSDRADTDSGTTLSFCAWPPPSWADRDGYSEIVVRTVPVPGLDEASNANEADYIKLPCHTVQLMYDFGSQGDYEHQPPITAKTGDVLPGKYRSQLPGYPSRDEVVYLHNDKQGLYSASCVS